MPITLRVDHERQETYATAEGSITLADIRSHLEEERDTGALAYREAIDASTAVASFSSQDVRTIVELLRELGRQGTLGLTAIVVADDLTYGMLRVLQTLVEDVCSIRPFRSVPDAEGWLEQVESSVRRGENERSHESEAPI
jgi:hypothetical protein